MRLMLIASFLGVTLGMISFYWVKAVCLKTEGKKGHKLVCCMKILCRITVACSALAFVIAITFWFAITGNVKSYTKTVTQKVTQSSSLMALKSTSEQESSLDGFGWVMFGSGSGYVDGNSKEVSYYKFYIQSSGGEVKQIKVKPNDVVVKISTEKPHYDTVEVTTTMTLKQEYQAIGISAIPAPLPATEEKHILYIPKDSIEAEYSLN